MLCPRWKVNTIPVVLWLAIVWNGCDILSRVAGDASSLSSCAVCGSWGPDSLPLRDKTLPDLGVPVSSCADLETTAGLVDVDSSICQNIQLFSTYCGCRRAPDACTLCWDGRDVTNPRTQLPNYRTTDFFVVGTERILDCESLQSYMHRRHNESQSCFDVQLDVGEQCGCPSIPPDARSSTNNTTTNTTLSTNSTTPGYPVNATNSTKKTKKKCTLCENGEPPPFPDMRVDLGREVVLTCGEWDRSAWVLEADSGDCGLMRAASRLCGCPVRDDQCTMCPHREPVPWPDRHLNWLEESFLSTERSEFLPQKSNDFLTCGLMESIVARDDNWLFKLFAAEEELVCLATQMKSWICGCKPDWRAILLTWCYRTSGILSCLGSATIITNILWRKQKSFTTYCQLVLGISIFDITSSTAYALVGVMAPQEAGFYQSRGNATTCKVQGFMIQLGQTTSMIYNLCLSLYYFLVIIFSWRERKFKKILVAMHVCAIVTGLSLAVAAVPFIEPQFGVCGILPPLTASQWQVSLFYTVPVCVVLCVLTMVTAAICRKVLVQRQRGRRWMMDTGLSVTRKVFWQSVWYVTAFYLTLPFVLLSFYIEFKSRRRFWILVVTAVLAPLQGLMNALVYFQRTKTFQSLQNKLLCRCSSSGSQAYVRWSLNRGLPRLLQNQLSGLREGVVVSAVPPDIAIRTVPKQPTGAVVVPDEEEQQQQQKTATTARDLSIAEEEVKKTLSGMAEAVGGKATPQNDETVHPVDRCASEETAGALEYWMLHDDELLQEVQVEKETS